jgi:hypothetical protein
MTKNTASDLRTILPELQLLVVGQVVEHELEQEGHVVNGGPVVAHPAGSPDLRPIKKHGVRIELSKCGTIVFPVL